MKLLKLLQILLLIVFISCSSDDGNDNGQSQLPSSSSVCHPRDNNDTHYCSNGTTRQYGLVTHNGQTYKTVKIGTQTWMAENLNSNANGSVCYGNNAPSCNIYGKLYDWATAQSACPNGWRLPSNEDWGVLFRYVDGPKGASHPSSLTAGKLLKVLSWEGEDTYGFAALAGGGFTNDTGIFGGINFEGSWWNTTEEREGYAHTQNMFNDPAANIYVVNKLNKYSVRCLQP